MTSFIYNGTVIHKRLKPKIHLFKYRVFSLLIDLSELKNLDRKIKFFSLNRFNLISFFEKDHGGRDGSSLIDWVKKNPVKWDIVPSKKSIENLINEKNVFQIFKALYSYSNPKFWCCKSLDNFNFYNNNSFKNLDPIYIYIYRDGRDVASSFKKASIGEKHIYHIAKKWNRDQRKCLELKHSLDKYNLRFVDFVMT